MDLEGGPGSGTAEGQPGAGAGGASHELTEGMSDENRERIDRMREAVGRLIEGEADEVETALPDGTTVRLTRDPGSPQGFRSTAYTDTGEVHYTMRSFAAAEEAPNEFPDSVPFVPGCLLQLTEFAEDGLVATWMVPDGADAFGRVSAWHRDAGWQEESMRRSEEELAPAIEGLRARGMSEEMIAETLETVRNAPGARFLRSGLQRELMVMSMGAGAPSSMTLSEKSDLAGE